MRSLTVLITLLLFSSCWNNSDNQTIGALDTTAAAVDTNYVEAHVEATATGSWIESFRDLRTAVLNGNVEGAASYFRFPLDLEASSIWTAIEPTAEEIHAWKSKAADSLSFSKQDFKQFFPRIFSKELKMGLAKVKSEELYSTGAWSSAEFKEVDRPFQFHVQFDKESNTLHFNVAFFGDQDEEGNYVSEGEYNVIYVFNVVGNKLQFDRMVIAG